MPEWVNSIGEDVMIDPECELCVKLEKEHDILKAELLETQDCLRASREVAKEAFTRAENAMDNAVRLIGENERLKIELAEAQESWSGTRQDIHTVEAERDSTMKALRACGRHANACYEPTVHGTGEGRTSSYTSGKIGACVCGLSAALTPAPAEEGKRDE